MISVIIPVYNVGKKLNRMIDCLLKQSYKDFEVILVDDGSKDCSSTICDRICEKDNRFRVIHQPNSGVSEARNNGMKIAQGNYISFLDADDEISSNYFEILTKTQIATNAEIICCYVVCVDNNAETTRFTMQNSELTKTEALNLLLSRRKINSGPCAKLFKSDMIKDIFFPKLKVYEDILFVKDAFIKATKIVFTCETEYRYITNNNGAMASLKKVPSTDIIIATDCLTKYICSNKELSDDCLYITLSHLMQYNQGLISDKSSESKSFIKLSRKLYRKNAMSILFNRAFPWKEKIVFLLFAYFGK
ncbi:MAG: glycosyltransferase [Clostridia bacterium]|nr:glycosyltransferase [Clostridia bacterium]